MLKCDVNLVLNSFSIEQARMGDSSGARHNPAANEITGDEIGKPSCQ